MASKITQIKIVNSSNGATIGENIPISPDYTQVRVEGTNLKDALLGKDSNIVLSKDVSLLTIVDKKIAEHDFDTITTEEIDQLFS